MAEQPVGKLAFHEEGEEDQDQVARSTHAPGHEVEEDRPLTPVRAEHRTGAANRHPEQDMVAEMSQFDSFVNLLQSTNESELIRGCTGIRKLLSIERNPPIQRVIDSGSVPRLVQLMKESNSVAIQFETAWALTNIASGTSSQTRTIVNAGAIGVFVALLTHADVEVRETATWALCNIAGDSADHRDQVIRAGALQPLLSLATNSESRLELVRNCAQAISNMAGHQPPPHFDDLKAAIPVLAKLLFSTDGDVLYNTCWFFKHLIYVQTPNNYQITMTQVPTIVPQLITLLSHPQTDFKLPILRCLGRIAGGNDVHTRMVIDAGGIPAFVKSLQSRQKAIRSAACWALSNCTDYLQTLIDAGVFPHVIRIVMDDDPEVGKQGMWILSNASTDATTAQMHYLVDQGIMEQFVDALVDPQCEDRVVQLAIEGLTCILKSGVDEFRHDPEHPHPYRDRLAELGIIESLRDVEAHGHKSVKAKAKQLLTEYFAITQTPNSFLPTTRTPIITKYRMIECDRDILSECFAYLQLQEILRCTLVSITWNQLIHTQRRIFAYATYQIKRETPIQLPLKYRSFIRHIHINLPKKDPSAFLLTPTHSVVSLRDFSRATNITVIGVGRQVRDLPTLFGLLPDPTADSPNSATANDSSAASFTLRSEALPLPVADLSDAPTASAQTSSLSPILSLTLRQPDNDQVVGLLSHPRLQLLQKLSLNNPLSLADLTAIGTLTHLKSLAWYERVDSHIFHVIHGLPSLTELIIDSFPVDMGPPALPQQLRHLTIETAVAPFGPLSSLNQLETFKCPLKMGKGEATITNLIAMVEWLSQLTTLQSISLDFSQGQQQQIPPIKVLNCLTLLVAHNNSQLVVSTLRYGGEWPGNQSVSFRREPNRRTAAVSVSSPSTIKSNQAASFPHSIEDLLHLWHPGFCWILELAHVSLSPELVHSLEAQAFLGLKDFTLAIDSPLIPSTETIVQLYRFLGRQLSLERLTLDFTHLRKSTHHPLFFLVTALCQYTLPHLVKLQHLTLHPISDTGDYNRWGPYLTETVMYLPCLIDFTLIDDHAKSGNFLRNKEVALLNQARIKFTQYTKK